MLLNREQAAIGPRHRTLDQQQIALRIRLNHFKFLRRHASIAHATGHACSLENATWRSAGADGAGCAMTVGLAVCFGATAETVAFDAALETFTFGGADDIDRFAIAEQAGIELRAQFNSGGAGTLLQANFT